MVLPHIDPLKPRRGHTSLPVRSVRNQKLAEGEIDAAKIQGTEVADTVPAEGQTLIMRTGKLTPEEIPGQADAPGIYLAQLVHVSGRYYGSPLLTALTTLVLAANTLYGVSFYVPRRATYTSINIEVTTLAGGTSICLGVYADNNGVPAGRLLDAGTVSSATTGGKTITISQILEAGWYWLALVSDGTPSVRAGSQIGAMGWLGFTSGTDVMNHIGWSAAFEYAALPDLFTGSGALMTTAAPRLMLEA